jgi:hypothetical protein
MVSTLHLQRLLINFSQFRPRFHAVLARRRPWACSSAPFPRLFDWLGLLASVFHSCFEFCLGCSFRLTRIDGGASGPPRLRFLAWTVRPEMGCCAILCSAIAGDLFIRFILGNFSVPDPPAGTPSGRDAIVNILLLYTSLFFFSLVAQDIYFYLWLF